MLPLLRFARKLFWLELLGAALLTVGCNSQPEPVVPDSSRYEVAEEEGEGTGGQAAEAASGPILDVGGGQTSIDPGASAGPSSPALGARPNNDPAFAGQPGSRPNTATRRPPPGSSGQVSSRSPPPKPSSRPPTQTASKPASDRPEDVLAYINSLVSQEPTGLTPQEVEADHRQRQEKILQYAERLLGGRYADPIRMAAAEAKLTALASLEQLHVPDAQQRRDAFCLELINDSNSQLALLGRRAIVAFSVNAFVQGERDVQVVLEDFKGLLKIAKRESQLLDFASQVATLFEQHGRVREAIELLELVAVEFEGIDDQKLVAEVAQIREQAVLIETDLRRKFQAVVQRQPGAVPEFLNATKQLLADRQVGSATLRILLEQAGPAMEGLHRPSAAELYTLVEQTFANDPNQETVELVKSAAESFRRRSALIGQPFEVFGVTLGGDRFDWSQYQGKVVLVDFWATWCDLCLQEMPNIRQNYELYREQGFEVLGFNLDSDARNVERFFSVQRLPWPTIVAANPRQRGMQAPLAAKCGINYIPFVVLVGRDGRVAGLNVSGPDLGPKIAELLRAQ